MRDIISRYKAAMHFVDFSKEENQKFLSIVMDDASISNRDKLFKLNHLIYNDTNYFKYSSIKKLIESMTEDEVDSLVIPPVIDFTELYSENIKKIDWTNQLNIVKLQSIIDAGNLSEKSKLKMIVKEFLVEQVPAMLSHIEHNIDGENIWTHLPTNLVFSELNAQYEDDTTATTVNYEDMLVALKKIGATDVKMIAGETEKVKSDVAVLFNVSQLPDLYVMIISKILNIGTQLARQELVNFIRQIYPEFSEGDGVDESVIDTAYDNLLWQYTGEKYGDIGDGMSYYDYFIKMGFNERDAKNETINHVRRKILAEVNSISSAIEYCIGDDNEMEVVGASLVPKRKVKYDYAIDVKPPTLQITAGDFYVPFRQYAPFDVERCDNIIESITELLKLDDGTNVHEKNRLQMELSFYEFKKAEALCIEQYAFYKNIKLNFGIEWQNTIITDSEVEKWSRLYEVAPVQADVQDMVESVYDVNRKYIQFKLNERIVNDYIKELKSGDVDAN